MQKNIKKLGCVLALFSCHAVAAISVQDDAGQTVSLAKPAQRVLTLAPHVTELVFAAGGGDRIVGSVGYSDFPPAAKKIPSVGDDRQVDIERVLALKPDLIVVWMHGNTERQIEMLRKLNIPLFQSEPRKLDDIADSIERIGKLLGTERAAQKAADAQRATLAALKATYGRRPPVRVMYQVWDQPLYTLNGKHIVSDAIRLCGGQNIFANLAVLAPNVTVEAVLQENPEVILNGDQSNPNGGSMWKSYPTLLAVRNGNLFALDGDLLSRVGPRMVDGTAALCEKLELARQHRSAHPAGTGKLQP